MANTPRVIGIDLGMVIIGLDYTQPIKPILVDDSPEVKDSYASVKAIVESYDEVYIVSQTNLRHQDRIWSWLEHHDFYNRTGLSKERVLLCETIEEKAPICAEKHIQVFIDDRQTVMDILPDTIHKILFHNWPDAMRELRAI